MAFKETLRNFVDNLFGPPKAFLQMAIENISGASLITSQGLNVSSYMGIFGDMPFAWQLVVSSLLLMVVSLGVLLVVRSIMRIYFAVKEGAQWW